MALVLIAVAQQSPVEPADVVVGDIAANGVRFYSPDNDRPFMPLEFSVAAFRFGHSIIRPQYKINPGKSLTLTEILSVCKLLDASTPPKVLGANIIAWREFANTGPGAPQKARKIDPPISSGLANLPVFLQGSSISAHVHFGATLNI